MKRGRVGNGSSKYDFDNGVSLDADVELTKIYIDCFESDLKNLLKDGLSLLSIGQMRISIVDVMEDMGFLEGRK